MIIMLKNRIFFQFSNFILTALTAFCVFVSYPMSAAEPENTATAATAESKPDFWEQDFLTGDWGGYRQLLMDKGVALGVTYIGDSFGNPSGGYRHRSSYVGQLELTLDLDLDKLVGWSGGSIRASAFQIHGRGLSGYAIGNFNPVSNIEIGANGSTRLFRLWFEQTIADEKYSARIGQIPLDDEFFVSDTAATFLNGTFGWPAPVAVNLPSGGPAYPFASPGVRLRAAPIDGLTLLAAVTSGDPAGRPGDRIPEARNPDGAEFSFRGGIFAISEVQLAYGEAKDKDSLPGTVRLGGWYHSGLFEDQRYDDNWRSLASPSSEGAPSRHREISVSMGSLIRRCGANPVPIARG